MDPATFDWTRTIFDHVHVRVANLQRSKAWYQRALEPLAIPLLLDTPAMVAFGHLALSDDHEPTRGLHIAFMAASRQQVDAFHAAALAAGGTDNGAPGVREYGPPQLETYAAYVLDPDGTNVEAVVRTPIGGGQP